MMAKLLSMPISEGSIDLFISTCRSAYLIANTVLFFEAASVLVWSFIIHKRFEVAPQEKYRLGAKSAIMLAMKRVPLMKISRPGKSHTKDALRHTMCGPWHHPADRTKTHHINTEVLNGWK